MTDLIPENVLILLIEDLDNKPKRLLRNIPAQHLYLRMATEDSSLRKQLDKIKSADLNYLFLACSMANAKKYLKLVSSSNFFLLAYMTHSLRLELPHDLTCMRPPGEMKQLLSYCNNYCEQAIFFFFLNMFPAYSR